MASGIYNCSHPIGKKIPLCGSHVYFLKEVKGDSIFKIVDKNNLSYMIGKIKFCLRVGSWEEYSIKDNELMYKWTYKNDLRNGIYIDYFKDDLINAVGNYKDDNLNGLLVFFNYKRQVSKIEYWKERGGMSELIYSKEY